MPLFSSHHEAPPQVNNTPDQSPQRNRSLFSRNRSASPPADTRSTTTNGSNTRSGGFFGSLRSRSSDSSLEQTTKRNISRDPSIAAARMKVADAESAERAADDALAQARSAVKAAREHVKILENEALEDARRAKAKQAEARNVSKSARSLGRHG